MTTHLQHSIPAAPEPHRAAAGIAFGGSACLILFWTLYFTGGLDLGEEERVLAGFEAAFPVADAVRAAVLFAAGIGLWTGRRHGRFCLVTGSAMTLYLGILDVTFYAWQGLYAPLRTDGAVTLAINLLCLVGGIVGLVCGWKLGRTSHERRAA